MPGSQNHWSHSISHSIHHWSSSIFFQSRTPISRQIANPNGNMRGGGATQTTYRTAKPQYCVFIWSEWEWIWQVQTLKGISLYLIVLPYTVWKINVIYYGHDDNMHDDNHRCIKVFFACPKFQNALRISINLFRV